MQLAPLLGHPRRLPLVHPPPQEPRQLAPPLGANPQLQRRKLRCVFQLDFFFSLLCSLPGILCLHTGLIYNILFVCWATRRLWGDQPYPLFFPLQH